MRILVYKRTHPGDPDINGVFGVHDCMGQVRGYEFDSVIGVGGIGPEPRSYGIDGKINWVGVNAKKEGSNGYAPLVTFEQFVLLEDGGPLLKSIAPHLAKRMYSGGARHILHAYTETEKAEAVAIIRWATGKKDIAGNFPGRIRKRCRKVCSRGGSGRRC